MVNVGECSKHKWGYNYLYGCIKSAKRQIHIPSSIMLLTLGLNGYSLKMWYFKIKKLQSVGTHSFQR